jgi:hypothetical protein
MYFKLFYYNNKKESSCNLVYLSSMNLHESPKFVCNFLRFNVVWVGTFLQKAVQFFSLLFPAFPSSNFKSVLPQIAIKQVTKIVLRLSQVTNT